MKFMLDISCSIFMITYSFSHFAHQVRKCLPNRVTRAFQVQTVPPPAEDVPDTGMIRLVPQSRTLQSIATYVTCYSQFSLCDHLQTSTFASVYEFYDALESLDAEAASRLPGLSDRKQTITESTVTDEGGSSESFYLRQQDSKLLVPKINLNAASESSTSEDEGELQEGPVARLAILPGIAAPHQRRPNKRRLSQIGGTAADRLKQEQRAARRKARKAFRTITLILGSFALLWSPYYIVATVYGFCERCVPHALYIVSYYMCYVNSSLNPFCYALANRQYRAAFIRILKGDFARR